MSSVKNIIKSTLSKDKYGEIHPLTHINKKDTKLKKWIFFLSILTILNFSLFIYVFNLNENGSSINNQKESIKLSKTSEKIIKKSNKEEINLNLSSLENLSVKEKDLKKLVSFLKNEEIPVISLKSENKETSKFDIFYQKAKKYEKKGDILSSLYYYRKAYNINPDDYILYKIALFNFKLKHYNASIRYGKKIISNVKNEDLLDKAYYLIYKSYEKLGNKKKAKLVLEEAYYKLTNPNLVARALGKFYLKEGNLYGAVEIYESLAEKGDLQSAIEAGKIYEKLGEKNMALVMYKKALEFSNGKYKNWLEDKVKLLSN